MRGYSEQLAVDCAEEYFYVQKTVKIEWLYSETSWAFKQELSEYKGAKGSIQFPIGKPLP